MLACLCSVIVTFPGHPIYYFRRINHVQKSGHFNCPGKMSVLSEITEVPPRQNITKETTPTYESCRTESEPSDY